jgi:hypothetical protein
MKKGKDKAAAAAAPEAPALLPDADYAPVSVPQSVEHTTRRISTPENLTCNFSRLQMNACCRALAAVRLTGVCAGAVCAHAAHT